MVFGSIFMGFWWGEYEEHDGSLKFDFWTSFDGGVFCSELVLDDFKCLARFMDEPLVDFDSLGDFELNGMI